MLRVTLAQMRASARRLASAGVAIAIGAAFVAATLLASAALTRGTLDSITAQYGQADLVVSSTGWYDPDSDQAAPSDLVSEVETVPGVAGAANADIYFVTYDRPTDTGASRQVQLPVVVTADTPALTVYSITEGRAPQSADEIAIPADTLSRLDAAVSDTITMDVYTEDGVTQVLFTIVGVAQAVSGAWASYGPFAVMTPDGLAAALGSPVDPSVVTVALDPGADSDAVASGIHTVAADALGLDPALIAVQSRDDAARASMSQFSGGQDVFTAAVLAFAALALLVAGLVIANTFQVLVAQRTRTLALLRCTGASKRQLRQSVLTEGALLGFASSAVGVVLGGLLAQGALSVLSRIQSDVPIPAYVTPTLSSILVPLALGTLVTVLACLVPAREATAVAPLAALRPASAPSVHTRAGRGRAIFSGLLTLGGAALLLLGLSIAKESVERGLLSGVAGGALSFIGVALAAVFWLPPVSRLLARAVAKIGPSARLAAANVRRNPRRTAATSTALLIGVTLVTTMAVAAESARATVTSTMDSAYPVDALVTLFPDLAADDPDSASYGGAVVSPDVVTQSLTEARSVRGVSAAAAAVETTSITTLDGAPLDITTLAVDGTALSAMVGVPEGVPATPGTLIVSQRIAENYSIADGTQVRLGSAMSSPVVTVRVVAADSPVAFASLTDADSAAQANSNDISQVLLVRFAAGSDLATVTADIDDAVVSAHWTYSPGLERAQIDQAINIVLAVVIGLLGVAVVIALIGVANTLALSVIERRRETATLRAMGQSRGQVRRMLAVEGIFIAGVGALLGIVLGLLYGWAGAQIVLGQFTDPQLVVPWGTVAAVLAVAGIAGVLASVAPARSALKASPVEALADL